jgi:iron(III) transport system substrate-binding protein
MRLLVAIGLAMCFTAHAADPPRELLIAGEGSTSAIAPLIHDFEAKHGVKVRMVPQGALSMAEFLPKVQADLIFTSVSEELEIAKGLGQLQKITAPVDWARIPERLRDADSYWTAYAWRVRSIFYNTDKLKPEEVPSYEGLADPKWQGRICTRNPDYKYDHAFVSWMLATKGEAATKTWIAGFRRNVVEPVSGADRDQARGVLAGRCDIALCNSYYMAELLIAPVSRVAVAARLGVMLPNQAQGGAFPLINGVAILKQSPNPALANAFVEHLLAYLPQRWIADMLTTYAARTDIEPEGLLKTYGLAAGISALPLLEPTPLSRSAPLMGRAQRLLNDGGFISPAK